MMPVPLLSAAPAAGPAPVPGGNADGGASFGAALQDVLAGPAGGDGHHGTGKHASDDGDTTTGALTDLPDGAVGMVATLLVPGQNRVLLPGAGSPVQQPGTPATEAAAALAVGSIQTQPAQTQPAQALPGQARQPGAGEQSGPVVPGIQASASGAAEPQASILPVTAQVRQQPHEPAPPPASLPGRGQVAVPAPIQIPHAVPTAGPAAQSAAPFSAPFSAPSAAPGFAPGSLAPQLAGPLFSLAAAGPGRHVMTLQVSPEDLGPVTVRAHIDGTGVRIELFAPGDPGRDALRAVLPELRRGLAETGLGTNLDLSDQGAPPAWDTGDPNGRHGNRGHNSAQQGVQATGGTASEAHGGTAVARPRHGAGALDVLA